MLSSENKRSALFCTQYLQQKKGSTEETFKSLLFVLGTRMSTLFVRVIYLLFSCFSSANINLERFLFWGLCSRLFIIFAHTRPLT